MIPAMAAPEARPDGGHPIKLFTCDLNFCKYDAPSPHEETSAPQDWAFIDPDEYFRWHTEFGANIMFCHAFTFGGYGEIHANFGEGKAPDQIDIHRLVAYVGYEFNDWIRFHSETEIEHAFVSSESGGEISIEQAYLDFLLSDRLNVRFGRFLTPIGIINRKHEPPTFNGVDRPAVDQLIIPTTWRELGAGVYAAVAPVTGTWRPVRARRSSISRRR